MSKDIKISELDHMSNINWTIIGDSDSNEIISLPSVSGNIDKEFIIYNNNSYTNQGNNDNSRYITINCNGSETINGNTSINLVHIYDRLHIKSNGILWLVMDSHISYDTGWVSLADWTDATETITHNIGVHLSYLRSMAFWSTSGADGSDNYRIDPISLFVDTGSFRYGSQINGSSATVVIFQTGANGCIYYDSSGITQAITSGYYRVFLERKL